MTAFVLDRVCHLMFKKAHKYETEQVSITVSLSVLRQKNGEALPHDGIF